MQVPDIERLMDQSKLRRTRLFRHKTELMYRSSVNNSDRTTILLHNSPLPAITESGQAESISRYLPSWVDDQSVSGRFCYTAFRQTVLHHATLHYCTLH